MANILLVDGNCYDLHTNTGRYQYLANRLEKYGAGSDEFSLLERLYKEAECSPEIVQAELNKWDARKREENKELIAHYILQIRTLKDQLYCLEKHNPKEDAKTFKLYCDSKEMTMDQDQFLNALEYRDTLQKAAARSTQKNEDESLRADLLVIPQGEPTVCEHTCNNCKYWDELTKACNEEDLFGCIELMSSPFYDGTFGCIRFASKHSEPQTV